jgi:hypothetical protein
MEQEPQFTENIQICSDWAAIAKAFDSLPKPSRVWDEGGEMREQAWVFRGHKRETYSLVPSIEREWPYAGWPYAEYGAMLEFQSKSRLHMAPSQLPESAAPEHKLSWLAIMQHYGVPTRLLDFTYSPYVALYFALRNRAVGEAAYAEVWGIDAEAVKRQSARRSYDADEKIRERQGVPKKRGGKASFLPEDAESILQAVQREPAHFDASIRAALNPCGVRREHLIATGLSE